MDPRLNDFLSRALLLDLETGPNGALHKIGAVRDGATFLRQGRFDERAALADLDRFATTIPSPHACVGKQLFVQRRSTV